MPYTEPHTEAPFFPLPQVDSYWRDMAGAYRDMAPEGFRELLLSLPPHGSRGGTGPRATGRAPSSP